MKKIDVSKYDTLLFNAPAHACYAKASELYKTGDYTGYIKNRCFGLLLSQCNFLFSMRGGAIPSHYEFPTSGRDHDFQAFKKLGYADTIQLFNESRTAFYNSLTSDFKRIRSTLDEHLSRWKSMNSLVKVNLIEELCKIYTMDENILGGDSRIYELYFIYENQYLHEQFDRFMSGNDFLEWWDKAVSNILK